MKLLTLNFLTCARKACKSSPAAFPLHPRDAELEVVETDLNPPFIRNILPRLEWDALRTLASEVCIKYPRTNHTMLFNTLALLLIIGNEQLGLHNIPEKAPEFEALGIATADTAEEMGEPNQLLKALHNLLLETTITSGKLVCANCEHEYAIKEGIANFLLPSHLV